MKPVIHLLAERADWLPLVAAWIYNEWWTHVPEASLDTLSGWLQTHLIHDEIPLTLVAALGDCPVGTVTLLHHDVETEHWSDLSPWLAALYVVPEQRHHGIGRALVNAAAANATRLGVETLYLLTGGQEAFYARLGWEKIEQRGRDVVMAKCLVVDSEKAP